MENNPTLLAVVRIRNLVIGLADNWKELKTLGAAIDADLEKTSRLFLNGAVPIAHERWLMEYGRVQKNVAELKVILQQVSIRIRDRNTEGLTDLWEGHTEYSSDMAKRFAILEELGKVHLSEATSTQWMALWEGIYTRFSSLQELVQASSLHLAMMATYAPTEVDSLTETILKNMPKNYSEKEAQDYEQEYMEAYRQLQKEATQKKNLWDKFLDILAGGVQQTPAQMVMMKRWVDGEKGEL